MIRRRIRRVGSAEYVYTELRGLFIGVDTSGKSPIAHSGLTEPERDTKRVRESQKEIEREERRERKTHTHTHTHTHTQRERERERERERDRKRGGRDKTLAKVVFSVATRNFPCTVSPTLSRTRSSQFNDELWQKKSDNFSSPTSHPPPPPCSLSRARAWLMGGWVAVPQRFLSFV